MAKHDSQLVAASDHAVCELLEAIRLGRQRKFNSAKVIRDWAKAHGIKDVESFVKEAKAMFETEVVIRCLGESGRPSQPLFSPVYSLFHAKGATGRACPSALGTIREVSATTCIGCFKDHCSERYRPFRTRGGQ